MVLEATIVCVDNSEFSRNGDFGPTRFAAQVDSVNVLCSAKVQSHPESSVGLLTLAGRSSRILVTSTRDMGRIFTSMHDVKYDGMADFMGGIQKAQLALKHRQNTRQRQRIVVFVSSPLKAEAEELVKLGKKLKKNNVAIDVINIGLEADNQAKIDAFIEAVNSNENSHALHVAAGDTNLADALMRSEIYIDRDSAGAAGSGSGTAAGTGGATGGDASEFPFGVDPAEDPELVMALRLSMEEHRTRQAAEAAANTNQNNEGQASKEKDGKSSGDGKEAQPAYDDNDDDLYGTGEAMDMEEGEEEMLRRAIELSKADAEQADDKNNSNDGEKKD